MYMLRKYLTGLILLSVISCKKAPSQQSSFPTYDSLKKYISVKQQEIKKQYDSGNTRQKDSLVKFARELIFTSIINDFFSFWYGTDWSFYGCTQKPGEGSIACGYFVSTVLEDAGFNVPRVKWAQMASEPVILKMTDSFKRFRNKPVKEVETYIKKSGEGLYVVGLDNHVGFIYYSGDTVRFVHSNYYEPSEGVTTQELDSHNPLKNSTYRIVGKILGDEMIKAWILGKKIE
jgi:hypothetical protein